MELTQILVQVTDRYWTSDATHKACQLARLTNATVIFLRLIPAYHVSWLGTDLGDCSTAPADLRQLKECSDTAEDYGVTYRIEQFQYVSYVEGMAQAAAYFRAQLLFAKPFTEFTLWANIQTRLLRRALLKQRQRLADDQFVAWLFRTNVLPYQEIIPEHSL